MNRRLLLLTAIFGAGVAAAIAACDTSILGSESNDSDATAVVHPDARVTDSMSIEDTRTDAPAMTDTGPGTPDVGSATGADADTGAGADSGAAPDGGRDAATDAADAGQTVCDLAGHGADGKIYNSKCFWIAADLGKGSESATNCGNGEPAKFAQDPKDISALDWPNFGKKCNKIPNAGYCWIGDSTGTNNCKNGPLSAPKSPCCEVTYDGKVAHASDAGDVAKCDANDVFYAICQSK